MSKAKIDSVKFTGANIKDELIGMIDCSSNLRIQIHKKQNKEEKFGGRIKGLFTLLDAGDGDYRHYLKNYVGNTFEANILIKTICQQIRLVEKRDLKGLQIFNRNILKVISK